MDNLKHLVAAYFYEAWDEYEYTSWEQAVDDFVRRSPERARLVPGEIDQLVASVVDDQELDRTLVGFGFSSTPPDGDRTWLGAVRDRIAARLEAGSS